MGTVPQGEVTGPLGAFLDELDGRVSLLEAPQGPSLQGAMASANLSVANAATYKNCIVALSDLGELAFSDGAHWYPITMGAAIV